MHIKLKIPITELKTRGYVFFCKNYKVYKKSIDGNKNSGNDICIHVKGKYIYYKYWYELTKEIIDFIIEHWNKEDFYNNDVNRSFFVLWRNIDINYIGKRVMLPKCAIGKYEKYPNWEDTVIDKKLFVAMLKEMEYLTQGEIKCTIDV